MEEVADSPATLVTTCQTANCYNCGYHNLKSSLPQKLKTSQEILSVNIPITWRKDVNFITLTSQINCVNDT